MLGDPPARRTGRSPGRSSKVGIVGAGLMASQLALLFARRLEVPVVLTDLDQQRVDAGVATVHREVDTLLAKGRINRDQANRLQGTGHRVDGPQSTSPTPTS